MSLLRSLKAYIGLGPDEEYEDRYLYDLDLRSAEIDLTDSDLEEDDDEGVELASASFEQARARSESAKARSQLSSRFAGTKRTNSAESDLDASDSDRTGPMEAQSEIAERRSKNGDGSNKDQKLTGAARQNLVTAATSDGVVRSLDRHRARPRTITPTSFADSKVLADEFNRGVPIVLDLQGQGRELSRRLIDFASGACYVLDGSMEKVSPHVFLLTPRSAKVSRQDRRLIEEGGYDR